MIVDTSVLVAIAKNEPDAKALHDAIMTNGAVVPVPVLVEFERVVTDRGKQPDLPARAMLTFFLDNGLKVEPFSMEDSEWAIAANSDHGLGNGRGGTLNFGDLMVYAVAKRLNMPVLCTGRDFAGTDIAIHPASRAA